MGSGHQEVKSLSYSFNSTVGFVKPLWCLCAWLPYITTFWGASLDSGLFFFCWILFNELVNDLPVDYSPIHENYRTNPVSGIIPVFLMPARFIPRDSTYIPFRFNASKLKLFSLELTLPELPNSAINTIVPSSFQDFKHSLSLLLSLLLPQNILPSNPGHPFFITSPKYGILGHLYYYNLFIQMSLWTVVCGTIFSNVPQKGDM